MPQSKSCLVILVLTITLLASWVNVCGAEQKKKKREPIYDKKANATAQIADALLRAKQNNKRVLIVFGGNWCGWCYKLHDLFETNRDIHRTLQSEYELVLVDIDRNRKIGEQYKIEKKGFPYLTVLDSEGKVVKNQNTDDLEKGSKHDPDKVLAFLKKWKAEPFDAEKVLKRALQKAKENKKMVFVRLSTPGCGWCRRLEDFLHRKDIADIISHDFVGVKIDLVRMKHGKEVGMRLRGDMGGVPWFAFLDDKGHKLITSDGPKGNIGCPATLEEVDYFKTMLRRTVKNISAKQVDKLAKELLEQEAKRKRSRSKAG